MENSKIWPLEFENHLTPDTERVDLWAHAIPNQGQQWRAVHLLGKEQLSLCGFVCFMLQYWQKLIRMSVEPQAAIQFHVQGNLRALGLTKSITQFEEPVSLPHITLLFLFHFHRAGGQFAGWPVSRRNGSAPSQPPAALSLGEGGGSLEVSRELLEQSTPITATSNNPEVFVSRRCIRVR